MSYVVIVNTPNNVATVHDSKCAHIQRHAHLETPSAHRAIYDDGLDAILAAKNARKLNSRICGHCLHDAAEAIRIA